MMPPQMSRNPDRRLGCSNNIQQEQDIETSTLKRKLSDEKDQGKNHETLKNHKTRNK